MAVPLAAVTLDAAGTLFVPREPVGATYARVAAAHGIAARADDVERRFRAALAAAPPHAFPGIAEADRAAHERRWWRTIVEHALGEGAAGAPRFAACFDALFDHFGRSDAWTLTPGARDALATVRRAGLRLGVVSNFDGRLAGLLDGLGLAPLLDAVVFSSAAGVAKPDPRLFRAAADHLGITPAEMLHVGDDLESDVRGALRAGCQALLLTRDDTPIPPGVPALRTLTELPAAVERLRVR